MADLSGESGDIKPLRLTWDPEMYERFMKTRSRIDRAFDPDDETMAVEERRAVIALALENIGLRYLDRCDSAEKICRSLKDGTLDKAAVWQIVRLLREKGKWEGKRAQSRLLTRGQ